MKEEWKDILGYEGLYQVSNLGRVKRLKGKCLSKAGKYRTVSESILVCFPNKTRYNYLYVNLNNNGIKQFRLHRLVALHFIPNPNNLPEVNHIDGNKENNCITNLEWCTNLENIRHSYKIGTHKVRKNDDAPNTKLNSKQVMEIRKKLKEGFSGRSLSKEYNISEGMISLIKNNKYWI
jgi:hypothetical protein